VAVIPNHTIANIKAQAGKVDQLKQEVKRLLGLLKPWLHNGVNDNVSIV
jgi:hypothetical protein